MTQHSPQLNVLHVLMQLYIRFLVVHDDVCNSKSFHDVKCISSRWFFLGGGWFLCDNHNKCWFLYQQHSFLLLVFLLLYIGFKSMHSLEMISYQCSLENIVFMLWVMQILIKCMFEETCWPLVNKMTEKNGITW